MSVNYSRFVLYSYQYFHFVLINEHWEILELNIKLVDYANAAGYFKKVNVHYIPDTCAFDVCLMYQNGEDLHAVQQWIEWLQDNLGHSMDIIARTAGLNEGHVG